MQKKKKKHFALTKKMRNIAYAFSTFSASRVFIYITYIFQQAERERERKTNRAVLNKKKYPSLRAALKTKKMWSKNEIDHKTSLDVRQG